MKLLSTRSTWLVSGMIFLATFSMYFFTASKVALNRADSAELMTAAYYRGLAHPPGYPLYTAMLELVMHLPVGSNPAYLGSLFSGLCQSMAVVLFYWCTLKLIVQCKWKLRDIEIQIVAIITSLILAFSGFYWDLATYAEVFGLSNIFLGLLIYGYLSEWFSKRPMGYFFLWGMALAHHQLSGLLMPGFLISQWPWVKKNVIKMAIPLVVGFGLPYALVLGFFKPDSPISWYFEPSVQGFWQLISRGILASKGSAIETYAANIDLGHSFQSLIVWLSYLVQHFQIPAMFLGSIGVWRLTRIKHKLARYFLISWLIAGPLLVTYLKFPLTTIANDHKYYAATYLLLRMLTIFEYLFGFAVVFGLVWLLVYFKKHRFQWASYLLILIPLAELLFNFPLVNKQDPNLTPLSSEQILTSLPERSLLMIDSDLAFGLIYTQSMMGLRSDVLLVPTAMHMRWGYLEKILPAEIFKINGFYQLILSLVNWGFEEKRPVYVLSPSDPFIKQMVAYKYHLNPTGVLVEIGQQDNEVEPLEGATIQCEQMPNQREDIWLRGEKGELASIYLTNVELALNLKQKNLAQDFLLLAKDCGQGTADFRNKFASLETAIMDLNQ